MNNFHHHKKLMDIATSLGYVVCHTQGKRFYVNHFQPKMIVLGERDNHYHSEFEFAHEIGHCIQFKKRSKSVTKDCGMENMLRKRKERKFQLIFDEVQAWIIGYELLIKHKIPRKGYWRRALYCIKSYL